MLLTGKGAAELDFTGPIPAERARQLACDAGISRIITAGASQPLDVGRRTRTVPTQLRRALAARDRGCKFPSCDRPVAWCDAHHRRHWADGGPTVLANLVLLCRLHHTMIHQGWSFLAFLRAARTRNPGQGPPTCGTRCKGTIRVAPGSTVKSRSPTRNSRGDWMRRRPPMTSRSWVTATSMP